MEYTFKCKIIETDLPGLKSAAQYLATAYPTKVNGGAVIGDTLTIDIDLKADGWVDAVTMWETLYQEFTTKLESPVINFWSGE